MIFSRKASPGKAEGKNRSWIFFAWLLEQVRENPDQLESTVEMLQLSIARGKDCDDNDSA